MSEEIQKAKAHGIMFHHFHDDDKHVKRQGSLSADELNSMLDFYGKNHNIISAEKFLNKALDGSIQTEDVCLTFDDGLLCQYEIAYPLLKKRNLTAFWFIPSVSLEGGIERLEIYAHFRASNFSSIELFYDEFFKITASRYKEKIELLKDFNPDTYLMDCPFYTREDKKFRFLRDYILGEAKYNEIMDIMLEQHHYNIQAEKGNLWLSTQHIFKLHSEGNIIGLHSHTHPTVMTAKKFDEQKYEYETNQNILKEIVGKNIKAVSYPCNLYNDDTFDIMRILGICIGFRANMADVCLKEPNLEYPREDHANILRRMQKFIR